MPSKDNKIYFQLKRSFFLVFIFLVRVIDLDWSSPIV